MQSILMRVCERFAQDQFLMNYSDYIFSYLAVFSQTHQRSRVLTHRGSRTDRMTRMIFVFFCFVNFFRKSVHFIILWFV